MAQVLRRGKLSNSFYPSTKPAPFRPRRFHQQPPLPAGKIPDFAFAFDIDGVLLHTSKPIPGARRSLLLLQEQRIPFILLTNGGGKAEEKRVAQLSEQLQVPLNTSMFVQSHTPFVELVDGSPGRKAMRDQCVLVLGGQADQCRLVAEGYGFRNVVTPADIISAYPTIYPFSHTFSTHYAPKSRPLPRPLATQTSDLSPSALSAFLRIDAILVFNDPRDWSLDIQLILDLAFSHAGYLGTLSPKNGDSRLPNHGYQQDGQPALYFSNSDLWWAASWHLPRLGQGGFREALEGIWRAAVGEGVILQKILFGKPHHATYAFAERRLVAHRDDLLGEAGKMAGGLKRVYMVGDNPESDIRGANTYTSTAGYHWESILVRSGVYRGGTPSCQPTKLVDDVWDAVQWGLKRSGWKEN